MGKQSIGSKIFNLMAKAEVLRAKIEVLSEKLEGVYRQFGTEVYYAVIEKKVSYMIDLEKVESEMQKLMAQFEASANRDERRKDVFSAMYSSNERKFDVG